jgi:FSR family fosmidomycin resistance protein-like MFS transporter
MWGLDGFGRIVAVGWGMSAVLYWQLRDIPARPDRRTSLREMLPAARRLFLPLFVFVFLRAFMVGSLVVFLPTLMSVEKGATFAQAGLTLTTYELPGVFGALASGAISERLGRTRTLVGATLLSSALMIAFLQTSGITAFLTLGLLGFTSLMVAPVLLALVQAHMPHARAVANGILLMLIFLSQPITSVLIGWIGDQFGLHAAFLFSAVAPLAAIPAILRLPKVEEEAGVPAPSDTEALHS